MGKDLKQIKEGTFWNWYVWIFS